MIGLQSEFLRMFCFFFQEHNHINPFPRQAIHPLKAFLKSRPQRLANVPSVLRGPRTRGPRVEEGNQKSEARENISTSFKYQACGH